MKMPGAAGCFMPRWGRRLIRLPASPDQRASFELGRDPAATARRLASIDFSHLKIAVLSHLSVDCLFKAVVFRDHPMTQRQDSAISRYAADLIPAWPASSLPSQAAPATFPTAFHHCADGAPG
ncbi:hypothetical protein BQ8482_570020 [Mesorhizobium delmotii]|uniref:Uncharacterized protein n=1 Tax=Mesorhizobium delmotii TaxID=1631247 RepID=A0A2P9AUW3_9HYPH|nr:hypothetical protein BQ8482_570020 [Mesorhizobium delmotii]